MALFFDSGRASLLASWALARSEQVNTKLIEYNRDGSEDAGVLTARAQQAERPVLIIEQQGA